MMVNANSNQKIIKNILNFSLKGQKCSYNITRYYMYNHLHKILAPTSHKGKALSISKSIPLCQILLDVNNSQIIESDYPEYDILKLPFLDNTFDYVVSDQVLEHVAGDPQIAIDETFRILKPAGMAIYTTCFMNPIHDRPNDFWRFTPHALELLCSNFTRIIDVGSWGNIYALLMIKLGQRFTPTPESSWHPLNKIATYNDPNWAIVSWIIAQK